MDKNLTAKKQKRILKKKKRRETLSLSLIFILFSFLILILLFFIAIILTKGFHAISWKFLFSNPENNMTEGGIFPAIIGTILVTFVSSLFSIPIGVASGLYLNEYAKKGRLSNLISLAVKNLAGVPSVIYGLFGVALFLNTLGMRKSVLTAGLTLGILTLPVVISATVEAAKNVPNSLRHASLALGANKWQTMYKIIIPGALPGIITGGVMALTRAIGETAPILFTGVAYYIAFPHYSLNSQFMSLSFHIFALTTQNANVTKVMPIAYGSAFILVVLVMLLSFLTMYTRHKMRK